MRQQRRLQRQCLLCIAQTLGLRSPFSDARSVAASAADDVTTASGGPAGWAQILLRGMFCELPQGQSPGTAAAAADSGFKVRTSSDPAERQKKLAAEIANGRMVMISIFGAFFQGGLTGSALGDWALHAGSPPRGFARRRVRLPLRALTQGTHVVVGTNASICIAPVCVPCV